MNQYLSKCKLLASSGKTLCIIAGNESCDLDSAVSSICFALFLSKNVENLAEKAKRFPIVPMMNVRREEIPLKTDVNYFLNENNIDVQNLICCDELPSDTLAASDFILVDHHVSKYSSQAIQVIDHRPYDEHCHLPPTCCQTIEQVASCASLIGDYIIKADLNFNRIDIETIFRLLYGPIVLDSFNFSLEANRFRPLDLEVANTIEQTLNISINERNELFRNLFSARFDTSSLNPLQILMKDLKIVSNENAGKCVAISSCTMMCQDFIKMENAQESIDEFQHKYKCNVLIMLGLVFTGESATRDFALINFSDRKLFDKIHESLLADEFLAVKSFNDCAIADGKFGCHNGQATRKHVIPIVRSCLLDV